jgi:hypothetical protein
MARELSNFPETPFSRCAVPAVSIEDFFAFPAFLPAAGKMSRL